MRQPPPCDHLAVVDTKDLPRSKTQGCEECEKLGQRWVSLRLCLDCGHIGCCESSVGKHASGHYRETGHATVQSAMPGQSWRWCYVDETMQDRT